MKMGSVRLDPSAERKIILEKQKEQKKVIEETKTEQPIRCENKIC